MLGAVAFKVPVPKADQESGNSDQSVEGEPVFDRRTGIGRFSKKLWVAIKQLPESAAKKELAELVRAGPPRNDRYTHGLTMNMMPFEAFHRSCSLTTPAGRGCSTQLRSLPSGGKGKSPYFRET